MVKTPAGSIHLGTLMAVAWRSMFLQSSWNFQRMQNLGFAYALYPVLKRLFPQLEARRQAVRRHLEFFNTHPYFAAMILGVVAKLEEKALAQGERDAAEAHRIKVGMMGPLAALGDTVFWAMLKPAAALLGVSVILVSPPELTWPALAGVVAFVGLYSLFHLGLRFGGVWVGYRRGLEIVKDLRKFYPQFISRQIGGFMAIVLGAIMAAYPWLVMPGEGKNNLPLFLGLTAVFLAGLRWGLSVTQWFYVLVAGAIGAGTLGWI